MCAGSVQAGEPVVVAEKPGVATAPAPADYGCTGFYVGLPAISGRFSDNSGVTSDGTDGFGLQAGYLRNLGRFVVGGKVAYASGDHDAFTTNDWTATRLKLIGGLDVGRVVSYGIVGLSNHDICRVSVFSEAVTIYALGAKLAVSPKIAVGLEYLIEAKSNFDNTGFAMENSETVLRVD